MAYVKYTVDTETTGLDEDLHDIIEVSMSRDSDNTQKTWYLKPLNPSTIDDKALSVNKHKREDLIGSTAFGRETYKDPTEVVAEMESWVLSDGAAIDDRVFIGQNGDFDHVRLKKLWKKVGCLDTFPFSDFLIDTLLLVRLIDVCTGKKRKRYNLSSLVKDFGITKQKAHRAEGDTKMTHDLFNKVFELIQPVLAEKCAEFYTTEE